MPAPALLIVHQGALGDLVCIFPVIAALRRRFRSVGLLCQEHLGRLAVAEGLVEAWFALEAAWTASLFSGAAGPEARSRLAPYAHILLFSRSQALGASLRGISGARLCQVPPRPPRERRVHVADYAWEEISRCGLLPPGEQTPAQPIPPRRLSGGIDRPQAVLIHPGAGSPRKRWPFAGFREVSVQLKARGLSPEFIIGPAEQDLLSEVERLGVALHRPAGSGELLALLRSSAAYIGNDSGVSHLAAWAGVPSVVIFGPTDPRRWRPRGHAVEIVAPALDCLPCFETARENCERADCLGRFAAGDVIDALGRVMACITTA